MNPVILSVLYVMLWCAFFAYLSFGVLSPLMRRVRELERAVVGIAQLLVDSGVLGDRLEVWEQKEEKP